MEFNEKLQELRKWKIDGKIYEVSLIGMMEHEFCIRLTYFTVFIALILCGIIFIMSLQPYAASFVFLFLVMKAILLMKWV